MATLDADQLADLQGDLGITDDQAVFTDAELHRNFTRAGSDYEKTVVICLRQILAQAAKLHNYRIAQSSHDLQQVYDNVRGLLDYWDEKVRAQASGGQVRIMGLRGVPPRAKDGPVV